MPTGNDAPGRKFEVKVGAAVQLSTTVGAVQVALTVAFGVKICTSDGQFTNDGANLSVIKTGDVHVSESPSRVFILKRTFCVVPTCAQVNVGRGMPWEREASGVVLSQGTTGGGSA